MQRHIQRAYWWHRRGVDFQVYVVTHDPSAPEGDGNGRPQLPSLGTGQHVQSAGLTAFDK